VNIRPLNQGLQKKAIEELNEDPARIEKDLEAFREWIKKSPHIIARDDDQFLVNFMRSCKYRMEKVKERFDLSHTLGTHLTENSKSRDILGERIISKIRKGIVVPLPNLESPDGPRYFVIQVGKVDPKTDSIFDVITATSLILELWFQEDDNMVISGQIGIIDLNGFTMSHTAMLNPNLIRKLTFFYFNVAPFRLKGLHCVNLPPVALPLFKLFQTLLSDKNKKRIFVHDDIDALHKVLPRKLLPKEYGGDVGTIQKCTDNLEKTMVAKRDFFLEGNYGVDETKRVDKAKSFDHLFGIEGSFRQLVID